MDIKINSNTVSVNNIIFVSPNGDDANDGLASSTPVKSWTGMLNVANNGDAVFFMAGEHEFVNDYVETSFNMAMIRDENKKLFFYSDPNKTKLNFTVTKGTNSYGRVQFFSLTNKDTILCNLNINIKSTTPINQGYNTLCYDSALTSMYNCFIEIDTPWSYICGCHGGGNTLTFSNCILKIKPAKFGIINTNTESFAFENSLVSCTPAETISTQNTITNTELINMSYEDIISFSKSKQIGVSFGEWSLWNSEKFLIKQNSEYFSYDNDGNKIIIDITNSESLSAVGYGLKTIMDNFDFSGDFSIIKIMVMRNINQVSPIVSN